jgi:ABC-type uncharacterized transport system substrate-binding protein
MLTALGALGLSGALGCTNDSSQRRMQIGFFSPEAANFETHLNALRSSLRAALPTRIRFDVVPRPSAALDDVTLKDTHALHVAVAATGDMAKHLRAVAPELPLLFACGFDPVTEGLADSYERPNRGASGFTYEAAVDGARAERLIACVPNAKRVGVVVDSWHLEKPENLQPIYAAFSAFGCAIKVVNGELNGSLESQVKELTRQGVAALYFPVSVAIDGRESSAIEVTRKYGMPAMFPYKKCVELGGLISYEAAILNPFEILARQCAMILRGVSVGEIPIESPQYFECAINFATAKQLALRFPDSLILNADHYVRV